ncbi:hypothetical protein I204_03364 [Kwoniella mangroviensis CBS 8886]|nr:hypothetical protein I204_03364 [Kwoniella mangroviensis CBS 8886]
MTIHIPLGSFASDSNAGPSTPSSKHLIRSDNTHEDLEDVLNSLKGSKRIVVVTVGAGISTAADIPDFRSSTGLFNDNVSKGKGKGKARDLFHVHCLSSPTLLPAHQAMITSLASLAISAQPTPFHHFLVTLAESGRLLRCYTQNVDGLESKVGLRIGIPPSPTTSKAKIKKRKRRTTDVDDMIDPLLLLNGQSRSEEVELDSQIIPLHGTIHTLSCTHCHSKFPIEPYLPLPPGPIPCPTCDLTSTIREALSERSRRKGHLRSDVILYGEEHPQGDLIGGMVERDLKVVDCLVVVGTTIDIPGVKRLIKEMSKALHYHHHHRPKSKYGKRAEGGKGKVILINDSWPKVEDGLVDYWIQSDIQEFTIDRLSKINDEEILEKEVKVPCTPTKKGVVYSYSYPPTPESIDRLQPNPHSRVISSDVEVETPTKTTTKKRGRKDVEVVIPTPVSTTKRKYTKRKKEREITPTPISRLDG